MSSTETGATSSLAHGPVAIAAEGSDRGRILVVGGYGEALRRAVGRVATDAGVEFQVVPERGLAEKALDEGTVRGVLLDAELRGAERLCRSVRSRHDLGHVPIVALARTLSDVTFVRAFRWGVDDVALRSGIVSVMERLAALPRKEAAPAGSRGMAVVAEADASRCDVIGRILTNDGYEVRYAVDERSARYYLEQPGMELVVMGTGVGDPEALYRSAGPSSAATWVLSCPPPELRRLRSFVRSEPRVVATSAFAPPENVLFLANEVAAGDIASKRETRRVLYGTTVAFRSRGAARDTHGFSYNVSARGMFVRTLMPPTDGTVWVDVRPPRGKGTVRLLGEVCWVRSFDAQRGASGPAGFGLRIVDGLGGDLAVWVEHYEGLVSAREADDAVEPEDAHDAVPTSIAALIYEHVEAMLTPTPADSVGEPTPLSSEGAAFAEDAASPSNSMPNESDAPPSGPRASGSGDPAGDAGSARAAEPPAGSERSKVRGGTRWLLAGAALTMLGALGFAGWTWTKDPGREAVGTTRLTPAVAPGPSPTAAKSNVPAPAPELAPAPPTSARPSVVAPQPSADDLLALGPHEAYLYVESPRSEDVTVQGVVAGRTNEWVKVRCGARFLRLGSPGAWATAGRVDVIGCRTATRILMRAESGGG